MVFLQEVSEKKEATHEYYYCILCMYFLKSIISIRIDLLVFADGVTTVEIVVER